MKKSLQITILSIGHLLVDLQGIYLINKQYNDYSFQNIILFFIVYNIIAFGFQVIFGYIGDKKLYYKQYVLIGSIVPSIGLLLMDYGLLAIMISTIGNALYHVGGGVISVNLYPKKAAPAGIFVAPGAIGVFLGLFFAKQNFDYTYFIIGCNVLLYLLLYSLLIHHKENRKDLSISTSLSEITLLVFLVVLIRGLVGFNLIFTWKSDLPLSILFVIFVFGGKFLGGILGDQLGYKQVGVYGLLLSIPFLLLGSTYSILGLIGSLLFNLTMAITLFIIIESYGKYQGFAFGLTTLSLLLSILLSESIITFELNITYYLFLSIIIIIGALLLYKAIKLYERDDLHV